MGFSLFPPCTPWCGESTWTELLFMDDIVWFVSIQHRECTYRCALWGSLLDWFIEGSRSCKAQALNLDAMFLMRTVSRVPVVQFRAHSIIPLQPTSMHQTVVPSPAMTVPQCFVRNFSADVKVPMSLIKELRSATGAPMVDVKEALKLVNHHAFSSHKYNKDA